LPETALVGHATAKVRRPTGSVAGLNLISML
jgi:hypothetical protein